MLIVAVTFSVLSLICSTVAITLIWLDAKNRNEAIGMLTASKLENQAVMEGLSATHNKLIDAHKILNASMESIERRVSALSINPPGGRRP